MMDSKKPIAKRRNERATEIIAHEAALFITREAGNESLITVIRAIPLAHGERMNVFVSVFPEEKSKEAMAFLGRHREMFSDYLKKHVRISPLPRVDFFLDNGESSGGPGGN